MDTTDTLPIHIEYRIQFDTHKITYIISFYSKFSYGIVFHLIRERIYTPVPMIYVIYSAKSHISLVVIVNED